MSNALNALTTRKTRDMLDQVCGLALGGQNRCVNQWLWLLSQLLSLNFNNENRGLVVLMLSREFFFFFLYGFPLRVGGCIFFFSLQRVFFVFFFFYVGYIYEYGFVFSSFNLQCQSSLQNKKNQNYKIILEDSYIIFKNLVESLFIYFFLICMIFCYII